MELTPPLGKRIKTLRLARALLTGKDYSRAKLVYDAGFAVSYAALAEVEDGGTCDLSEETVVKLGDALLGKGKGSLLLQKEWANTYLIVPLPATDPSILTQIAALNNEEDEGEDEYYYDDEESDIVTLSEIEMWA